jgi:hypothetical protein
LLNNVFSIKFDIKGIGRSYYVALFGCKARVGLASVGIPVNEIFNFSMVEHIEKIILQPENNEVNEIRDEKCLGLLIFLKL